MTAQNEPEVWLRGPLPDYPPELMPAAHALVQAREDIERTMTGVPDEILWRRVGEAASAGYHLQHLAGSLDRLFTYARGESLNDAQRQALKAESTGGGAGPAVLAAALGAIDNALAQLRATAPHTLGEAREVGRARLPTTVLGLLFHGAEHTTRHVGQLITTLRIVKGIAPKATGPD